jgi:adenylate kinase family enzyme
LEKALDALLGRDTKTLLPTEFILALVERAIDKIGRRAIFIDGFPRDLDQVSYSLYFRALIGYRDDPDFLVFIDVPQTVIHERMKYRVVCSLCNTPRNTKLLTTKEVQYDADKNEFFLICDNPSCEGRRMIAKEGDELGIDGIRGRIEALENSALTLLELRISGLLPAQDRDELLRLQEILASRFLFGRIDASQVRPSPQDESWLAGLPAGVLREAAARLQELTDPYYTGQRPEGASPEVAARALLELYTLITEVPA